MSVFHHVTEPAFTEALSSQFVLLLSHSVWAQIESYPYSASLCPFIHPPLTHFSGILDLIKLESLCSDAESAGLESLPGSRSTYYGILHDYDGGDVDSGTNVD